MLLTWNGSLKVTQGHQQGYQSFDDYANFY